MIVDDLVMKDGWQPVHVLYFFGGECRAPPSCQSEEILLPLNANRDKTTGKQTLTRYIFQLLTFFTYIVSSSCYLHLSIPAISRHSSNRFTTSRSKRSHRIRSQTKLFSTVPPRGGRKDTVKRDSLISSVFENTTTLEMTMMSAVGFGLSTAVVLTLASSEAEPALSTNILNDVSTLDGTALVTDGIEIVEEGIEELELITNSILSAAMPQSATDIIAIALGEGIAGVLGAIATSVVGALLRLRTEANAAAAAASSAVSRVLDRDAEEESFPAPFFKGSDQLNGPKNELISEAVADGDYFLTRAAAIPLLEAVGIPPFTATLASVLIATIPYEIIKISNRQKRMKEEEEKLFDQLFEEEQARRKRSLSLPSWTKVESNADSPALLAFTGDVKTLKRTSLGKGELVTLTSSAKPIDAVELFTDITKWLEYDVLTKDFSGRLLLNGSILNPAVESALFGFLAVLSTQLYADIIYRYSDWGTDEARSESRTRSFDTWASLYSTKCLSGAALFGVYEGVRLPISQFIQRLLAGGLDGCLGSKDINLCMETYMIDNPVGLSFEARFQAFFAAISRGTDFSGDVGVQELGRSIFVHFYSEAGNLYRIIEPLLNN
mmetsp:Transcript_36428/g.109408  ORF Transcript_36428/g.109408 Transcript_36428/m.109408 type:complete len:608 (-) Transcript_36428:20-1843(-)